MISGLLLPFGTWCYSVRDRRETEGERAKERERGWWQYIGQHYNREKNLTSSIATSKLVLMWEEPGEVIL